MLSYIYNICNDDKIKAKLFVYLQWLPCTREVPWMTSCVCCKFDLHLSTNCWAHHNVCRSRGGVVLHQPLDAVIFTSRWQQCCIIKTCCLHVCILYRTERESFHSYSDFSFKWMRHFASLFSSFVFTEFVWYWSLLQSVHRYRTVHFLYLLTKQLSHVFSSRIKIKVWLSGSTLFNMLQSGVKLCIDSHPGCFHWYSAKQYSHVFF